MLYRRFGKRLFDIVVSILALPLLGVVFLVCAPLIRLSDGGPVFYNANRRGLRGKVFPMYKFRSMKVGSPVLKGTDGATLNSENDPRVTRLGRILRKTSVDELPQLINVLKGDMSIVGPRPNLASAPYDSLSEQEKKRLEVRPGITGYSQAMYRNSIAPDLRYAYDCEYVDGVTFLLDLKIIAKTVESVLRSRNVNSN